MCSHRGGPKGFLRVFDDRTVAFADFAGNRQYITAGNPGDERPGGAVFDGLSESGNSARRLLGTQKKWVEDDKELEAKVRVEGYNAKVERVMVGWR